MAAWGCLGFVLEFNTYNISGDDDMSLTSLLHRAHQLPLHIVMVTDTTAVTSYSYGHWHIIAGG